MKLELRPRCVGKSLAAKKLKDEFERCGGVVTDVSSLTSNRQDRIWFDDMKPIEAHIFVNDQRESPND